MKNVAGTRSDLVNLGFKLGRHEDGEYIFPADFVRDVAICFGRVNPFGGGVLEKNSSARRKIFAVDNFDGSLANFIEQRRRAGRYAFDKRGHGLRIELHRADLDGDYGAFRAERKTHANKMFRNFFGDCRLVRFNGLAGRRRFKRGVHNNFGRGVCGSGLHNRQT